MSTKLQDALALLCESLANLVDAATEQLKSAGK